MRKISSVLRRDSAHAKGGEGGKLILIFWISSHYDRIHIVKHSIFISHSFCFLWKFTHSTLLHSLIGVSNVLCFYIDWHYSFPRSAFCNKLPTSLALRHFVFIEATVNIAAIIRFNWLLQARNRSMYCRMLLTAWPHRFQNFPPISYCCRALRMLTLIQGLYLFEYYNNGYEWISSSFRSQIMFNTLQKLRYWNM